MRTWAGKEIALHRGFKFYRRYRNKHTDIWACTQVGLPHVCKARLTMSQDKELLQDIGEHSHPPPNFIVLKGILISL